MKHIFSRHNTAVHDWLFWLSLLVTGMWFALKIAGVINTPFWIEFISVASIIFGAGILFQKVECIDDSLHDFKVEMMAFRKEVGSELKERNNCLIRIEARLTA